MKRYDWNWKSIQVTSVINGKNYIDEKQDSFFIKGMSVDQLGS